MKNIKMLIIFSITIFLFSCDRFSPLIGTWDLVSQNNPPIGGVVDGIEFYRDGTGRMIDNSVLGMLVGGSIAFTWETIEGNRLRMESFGVVQIYDIQISGSNLTFFYNRANNSYAVYKKK